MWRFMAVTFAFLGWSFYVLSGGSDYVPGENAFQADTAEGDVQQAEVQVSQLDDLGQSETNTATVTRSVASIADLALVNDNQVQVTLTSLNASDEYDPTAALETVTIQTEAADANAAVVAAGTDETAADQTQVPDSVLTGFVGEEVFSLETYVQHQAGIQAQPDRVERNADAAGGDIREVSGNLVNMRAGPGTDYEKVGKLSKGTQISVLEEPGNGWVMFEVLDTGQTGWMADWLLTASN